MLFATKNKFLLSSPNWRLTKTIRMIQQYCFRKEQLSTVNGWVNHVHLRRRPYCNEKTNNRLESVFAAGIRNWQVGQSSWSLGIKQQN
ncbi:hypothetical protein CEXT_697781 [Caerostris extrusa]|uniref:Ribosomal protein L20 n=1 Tax=Caerostris extrusa TaxID=172846 RepID=A0AAV4NHZ4_CAEEX|nr:hypothetical protein CEXT_697781 [Caerostris extrusa]